MIVITSARAGAGRTRCRGKTDAARLGSGGSERARMRSLADQQSVAADQVGAVA